MIDPFIQFFQTVALALPVWFALLAVGGLCWPIGMLAGGSLPDRGYVLGKIFGLWVIVALYWAFARWVVDASPLLFALLALLLGAAGWIVTWRGMGRRYMYESLRSVALIEALTLVAIVAGIYLRSLNPAITWMPEASGAEKAVDYAWFHAATRAVRFPLLTPWLAGTSANYYYYGHLVWATLFRAIGGEPAVNFNIALATVFALTVTGVFTIAWGLTRRRRWGALAVMLTVVGGNLDPLLKLCGAWANGGANAFSITWHNFDWWGSSRPITGSINEFPAFSFLLGDLHAHLSALPLTLAALMALLHLERSWRLSGGTSLDRATQCGGPLCALSLMSGLLFVTNSWDSISLGVACAITAAVGAWGYAYQPARDTLSRWALLLIGFGAALAIARATFCHGFTSPFAGQEIAFDLMGRTWRLPGAIALVPRSLMTDTREFFTHYGLIWAPLTAATLLRLAPRWWALDRSRRLFSIIAIPAAWLVLAFACYDYDDFKAVGSSIPATLVVWAVLVWMAWALGSASLEDRFVASLALTGAALALVCEFMHLDDIFVEEYARINTVFKLHYFVWTVWSLAAVAAWRDLFRGGDPDREGPRWPRIVLRSLALVALICVIATSALYPIVGVSRRANEMRAVAPEGVRGMTRRQFELDGAWAARIWDLADGDFHTARWLRENTEPQAFVCEAAGEVYGPAGRIALFAGVCAPAAWDQHLEAWSGQAIREQLATREDLVRRIYENDRLQAALYTLFRTRCLYVVVGEFERERYGDDGAREFARLARPVFQSGKTAVYSTTDLIDALLHESAKTFDIPGSGNANRAPFDPMGAP